MHNTSHEFGFVDITNRRSLKVISEISPPRPALPKTMELILVVVISAGMAENSQNGVSRSLSGLYANRVVILINHYYYAVLSCDRSSREHAVFSTR